jgi:hypothetical protein
VKHLIAGWRFLEEFLGDQPKKSEKNFFSNKNVYFVHA